MHAAFKFPVPLFYNKSAPGTPRTTDMQTFALKHFQSSQCHHGCLVPDSMFTNDHVITTLETILWNIYDQATVHNSWTHTCVSGFHLYHFPESRPPNSSQVPPPSLLNLLAHSTGREAEADDSAIGDHRLSCMCPRIEIYFVLFISGFRRALIAAKTSRADLDFSLAV